MSLLRVDSRLVLSPVALSGVAGRDL